MSVFVLPWTREKRSVRARLDRLEAQHEMLAADLTGAEEALAEARKRIEALEAERERVAPCPK